MGRWAAEHNTWTPGQKDLFKYLWQYFDRYRALLVLSHISKCFTVFCHEHLYPGITNETHTSRKPTLAQRQHANTSSLYYKLSADVMAIGLCVCVWHFHWIGNPVLSSAILTCKMMSERKTSSSIMYMLAPCKQKPWAAVHMDLKWQTKRGCLEQPAVSINNKVFELE